MKARFVELVGVASIVRPEGNEIACVEVKIISIGGGGMPVEAGVGLLAKILMLFVTRMVSHPEMGNRELSSV